MRKERKEKDTKKIKTQSKKAKTKVVSKQTKKAKKNVFSIIKDYFKGVFKELKKIRWTSPKDLLTSSITSVIFIAFFALYFAGIELLVSLLRSLGN